MSLSPLNVEKSRVVKNFCDTELLERERQKERKTKTQAKNFIPPSKNQKKQRKKKKNCLKNLKLL